MSKSPKIEHAYHSKKRRLDLSIQHRSFKKKSTRKALIDVIEAQLAVGKGGKNKHRKPRSPMKESKLPVVGD